MALSIALMAAQSTVKRHVTTFHVQLIVADRLFSQFQEYGEDYVSPCNCLSSSPKQCTVLQDHGIYLNALPMYCKRNYYASFLSRFCFLRQLQALNVTSTIAPQDFAVQSEIIPVPNSLARFLCVKLKLVQGLAHCIFIAVEDLPFQSCLHREKGRAHSNT